jgi:hypothetical protein
MTASTVNAAGMGRKGKRLESRRDSHQQSGTATVRLKVRSGLLGSPQAICMKPKSISRHVPAI